MGILDLTASHDERRHARARHLERSNSFDRARTSARALACVILAVALVACTKIESNVGAPQQASSHPGVVRIVGAGTIDSLVPELASSAASSDLAMFWGAWFFLVNDNG